MLRETIPTWIEATLPLFTAAGSIVRPTGGRNVFAKGKQQAVFSAAQKVFCIGKQLARKGVKAPPKSALFSRRLRHERIEIFTTEKFRCMEKNKSPRRGKGGRPPKIDTAKYRYSVNLSAEEHARFLTMYEQSGLLSKAAFIKARVFGDVFRVIKTDRGTMEYVAKLTQFHAQFRAIGTNYNQIVKLLHTHFSERKALAMLYKLENETRELAAVGQRVIALCEEFRERW